MEERRGEEEGRDEEEREEERKNRKGGERTVTPPGSGALRVRARAGWGSAMLLRTVTPPGSNLVVRPAEPAELDPAGPLATDHLPELNPQKPEVIRAIVLGVSP